MTTLITGGSGKTAAPLAALFQASGLPYLVASRRGAAGAHPATPAFDWLDATTWPAAFDAATAQGLLPITAVYLALGLTRPDVAALANAFVDFARARGARRFVLLSGSPAAYGGALAFGPAHAHLRALGDEGKIEWAVLRATWFQENLRYHALDHPVGRAGVVRSAAGDGRVPLVATADVAAVAYRALTDDAAPGKELLVLGPEPLTYDRVAAVLSAKLGREIKHERLSEAQLVAHYMATGRERAYAEMQAGAERAIADGAEDRASDIVERMTGRPPRRFEEFVEESKDCEEWKPQ